ncbi:MAG: lipid-A-disaccharide synthase [Candidatus Omnitrophica bacterium]|nr:lipid-A-disaccharide synthase [Candidatus Omnitrophota bacterium]
MAQIKKIFIVCGEPSGDLLAANLVSAIKNLDPNIKISGTAGTHLSKAGCEIFYDIQELAVMGFFDVLKKLPKFFKLKKTTLKKIDADKPDAVILVDFSGFNLRLAKAINKRLPVIYYVSPQVWASREGRINCIKKFISLMIVLFKFEEEFYQQRGIQTSCVGHPLIDLVKPILEKQEFVNNFRIDQSKKIIALLPGSRKQEIKIILPLMLKTAVLINKAIPQTQFIIAKAPNLDQQLYWDECKKFNLDFKIIDGLTYDCLNIAQASIVCSGTATLEAAIMQKPFVIVYKTNMLNYLLYRPQIKIPYIGMVNIVAGRKIVPEFIQFAARPKMIAKAIIGLLQNLPSANRMSQDLKAVKESLGEPGAAGRAAKLILEFLQKN